MFLERNLNADDVIIFMHPGQGRSRRSSGSLAASRLGTNHTNKLVLDHPNIHSGRRQLTRMNRDNWLPARLTSPSRASACMPSSVKKVPKALIQSAVDVVARRLLACHEPLMNKSGRLIWIKSVLSIISAYSLIASRRSATLGNRGDEQHMPKISLDRKRGIHPRQVYGCLANSLPAYGPGRPGHSGLAAHFYRFTDPMALATADG